jgi:hypothetical protein
MPFCDAELYTMQGKLLIEWSNLVAARAVFIKGMCKINRSLAF